MSEHTTRAINQPVTTLTTSHSKPNSPNRVLPDVVLQIIFSSLSTQEALPSTDESVGAGRWHSNQTCVGSTAPVLPASPYPKAQLSAAKMTELFQSDYWQKKHAYSLNLMTFTPHAQKLTKELHKHDPPTNLCS